MADGTPKGTASERVRQNMQNKTPEKNIDDIDDVVKMVEIFKLLKIEYDRNSLNLKKMKKKAKEVIEEQSSGSGKYSNGTTVLSINCYLFCPYFITGHSPSFEQKR